MCRRHVGGWLIALGLTLLTASAGYAAPSCRDKRAPNPPTDPKYQIDLDDSATIWQGPGGTIAFTITGLDSQKSSSVAACMRRLGAKEWSESTLLEPVRVAQSDGKTGTKFAVTIPAHIPEFPHLGWRFYPPAELRVVVSEGASSPALLLDVVRDLRISPIWFAAFVAVLFIAVASAVLYVFANWLGVPGTNFLLRIISSANGWASLAQLQIVLWTLVVGAGAVYVMTLRATLIEISTGTLVLLGIAGAAAVGSQLKSSQEAQGAPAAPAVALPGPITNLAPVAIGAREITLSWTPPSIGGPPRAYVVQCRPTGAGNWLTATTGISAPRFMLVGLAPARGYDVQVFATNSAGSGPAVGLTALATGVDPVVPSGAPGAVTGLARQGNPTANSITLRWNSAAGATEYTVEYRVHDSDASWQPAVSVAQSPGTLDRLRPCTAYDFRVVASNNVGVGPPSDVLRETSGDRIPQWSDIVTNTDRPSEIDITRVQMLLFTVISACFVTMKIILSSTIPEIPPSYVTLMGISNGLYLTAKFLGR